VPLEFEDRAQAGRIATGQTGRFVPSLLKHLAAILTLLATPAFADCQMQQVTSVPLLAGKHPTIEVAINGTPLPMAVDTGAQGSAVTPETVAALRLPRDPHRRTRAGSLGGQDITQNVLVETLDVPSLGFVDHSIAVLPLDAMPGGNAPAGLIGSDLLSGFEIELDIPAQKLSFYRATGCDSVRPPWAGRYETVVAKLSMHHDFLLPIELNGHVLTAMFDTGSTGETVSRSAAKSVGVSDAELGNDESATGTSAGSHGYAIRRHRFDSLRIGREIFRNVRLDVADFNQPGVDVLIGDDYMHRRRFFLSYSTATLFIQVVRTGSQAAPMDEAGRDRCRPPADLLPTLSRITPIAVERPHLTLPEKVRDSHIDGCAGVMFRLTADGIPAYVKLVIETPPGFGLGDFVLREIMATKYERPAATSDWYYEAHRLHPG
jgi:predicted aspartyl protease